MVEEILYEHGLNYYNGNYGVNKKVICNLVDNNMSIVTGETKLSDYVMIEKNDMLKEMLMDKIVKECNKLYNVSKKYGYNLSYNINCTGRKILWNSGKCKLEKKNSMRITLNKGRKDHCFMDIPVKFTMDENIGELENAFCELIKDNNKIDLKIDSCKQDVLMSPKAAGFFVHEILGHPLELDIVNEMQSMYSKNDINKQIMPRNFILTEAPNELLEFGYDYGGLDDEENELKEVSIIEKGILKSFIDYKRCSQFKYPCVNRMHNLVLRPNTEGRDLNSMISSMENGIIIDEIIYGNYNILVNRFNLICGRYRYIKDGKILGYNDGIIISDEISSLKDKIVEIGSDFKKMIGLCTKYGQTLNVGMGAPTILLRDINIRKDNNLCFTK